MAAPVIINVKGPETRTLVILLLFSLTFMLFGMIYINPGLTSNQGFMLLAQGVILTGLISMGIAFYFGASKGSTDASAGASGQVDRVIDKLPNPLVSPVEPVESPK